VTVFSVILFIWLVKEVSFRTENQNQLASTISPNKHNRTHETSFMAKYVLSVHNFQGPSEPILGEV